jgi:putative ABC transport system substrate-binding protein
VIGRRQFAAGIAAITAWPLAARAQEPQLPVVGYLGTASADAIAERVRAFVQGLTEAGSVEGKDFVIEYRWARGDTDRLPGLASELVRRQPAVIATSGGLNAARAAKGATASIPIVFEMESDPVEAGLVQSLKEPGGNVTGVNLLDGAVALLRELVPAASRIGVLVNPANKSAESGWRRTQAAARALGVKLQGLLATNEREFDSAFDTLIRVGAGALVISADPMFADKIEQLAALTLRHGIPAIHESRAFAAAGGLAGFRGNPMDGPRLAGVYVGRILKGEKPAGLPVGYPTKGELVINLKTAKELGLDVPPALRAQAEVIE